MFLELRGNHAGVERAQLEADGRLLEPGESVRMVCPFCGGGSSRERSLSLTHRHDGTLLYHCFRAHCGAAGILGANVSRLVGKPEGQPPPKLSRDEDMGRVEGRLTPLQGQGTFWHMDRDTLTDLGVKYDPLLHRLALPMWDPMGCLRGRVLRTMTGDTRPPKALIWNYGTGPSLGWNKRRGECVVVCEDIPSTMRLDLLGYRAVALCGSHVTTDGITEISKYATDILWALDRDAFDRGVVMHENYRLFFRSSAALLLAKDFKDATNEEINDCLSGIYSGPLCRAGELGSGSTG